MTQIRKKQSSPEKKYPPIWKIKRELLRVWRKVTSPLPLVSHWITRPVYDLIKTKMVTSLNGNVALGPDVAIFLIYAPNGALPSHIHTLKHLMEKGFSTLVVVNHKLSAKMQSDLRPYVWRMMERPNFGYDFGGYREGILYLSGLGIVPDHLLVMNDSVWFPLREPDDLLERMRSWTENIRGFARDRHKRSNLPPFVQSYMFMYDREIIQDPAFLDYWRSIMLTNNKHLVIRKLEMGMSIFFEKKGFSVRVQHEYARIGEILAALPVDRQVRFLQIEGPRLNGEADTALARVKSGDNLSREEWGALGELSQVDGHILKLPPDLLFEVFDVNMLKKLKQGHFREQRQAIRSGGYHEKFAPAVRHEVNKWDD